MIHVFHISTTVHRTLLHPTSSRRCPLLPLWSFLQSITCSSGWWPVWWPAFIMVLSDTTSSTPHRYSWLKYLLLHKIVDWAVPFSTETNAAGENKNHFAWVAKVNWKDQWLLHTITNVSARTGRVSHGAKRRSKKRNRHSRAQVDWPPDRLMVEWPINMLLLLDACSVSPFVSSPPLDVVLSEVRAC